MESDAAFIAFLALQMFGLCGGIMLLITALLSPSVGRHSTWFSFMFSWVLSAGSYCLLLFAGRTYDIDPPHAICLTQAAMVYAVPPLTAATTVSLVIQMYRTVKHQTSNLEIRSRRIFTAMLLGVPYFLYVAMLFGCVTASLINPDIVQRASNSFYCNLSIRTPSRIASVSVALLLGVTIVIQGITLWALRGNWGVVKGSILRVCAFSMFGILAGVLAIIFATARNRSFEPALSLALACIPAGAILIFGTQEDIVRAWMFWKRQSSPSFTPQTESRIRLTQI
ncbi:hypothetical protein BKA70DRAFT_252954 [Coprinopsis sp. MPI-PUGE-AT-0042]|nr:hypothetical protein BKA70DRAFT_252954 [Coprinopsis sp. MPI-PUGE-AT-0042]